MFVISVAASWFLWQKLINIQEQLAQQSAEAGRQASEARVVAKEAQALVRETAARLAVSEARLAELALQRSQLEELMRSLSRSRDENLVVDIESALRLAQQQAQLTGSVEPLLAALASAEARIARAAQPRLVPLQRALTSDIAKVKAATVADTGSLLNRLDDLTRMADELPLANAVAVMTGQAQRALPAAAGPAAAQPTPATAGRDGDGGEPGDSGGDGGGDSSNNGFFARVNAGISAWISTQTRALWQGAINEVKGLVRVSRIAYPEAALLSPEQSFFVRESLKLKLLNARLGLLARQFDSARADLAAANGLVVRYFDATARRTQLTTSLLTQVQGQMKSLDLPRIDDSLTALATAAAGR
jgi:uroporphyrin-3 C-methyltransferase